VKASQKDFASLAPKAAKAARVFFFCGPDEAGAAEAAQRITALLPDAGERVELAGAELRRDPVRLGDEARSTSLFGDARHIYVRAAGDEAFDAVEILLAGDAEPCPVLIVASAATDKSRTAKLLADRPDALVAICAALPIRCAKWPMRRVCGWTRQLPRESPRARGWISALPNQR